MIGFLTPERLANIPNPYKAQHELCFYIHDVMVAALKDAEATKAAQVTVHFESEVEIAKFQERNDPISYLWDVGRTDIARRIALNQVTPALYADFLHFLYEALICLEKRKFTVALALLRKPLQQNLLIASWMLSDESEFFSQFRESTAKNLDDKHFSPERRLRIVEGSLKRLDHHGLFAPEVINRFIYDKNMASGFAQLFALANHLVTSRGIQARTEDMNLNMIFKDPSDNDIYEGLYKGLSYVLIYAMMIQTALHDRMAPVQPFYGEYTKLVSMSVFFDLFVPKRSPLNAAMNRSLKTFLNCPYCKAHVRITKEGSGRFYILQKLRCKKCGLEHDFPFFWLLSKCEWSISEKNDGSQTFAQEAWPELNT